MDNRTEKFFNIIKARSDENEKSLHLLLESNCHALVGAIIRMELDSLIRVNDFNSESSVKKEVLLDNFFAGNRWSKTDRVMVESISSRIGWAKHIYEFGCALIHLSPYHDWATNDRISNLTNDKRCLIVKAIKEQQYDPTLTLNENFGFNDLIRFAPLIFKKLRDNLLCEMRN